MSFDDVTLLAFIGAAGLVMAYVFLLGILCATHRIEAAVFML